MKRIQFTLLVFLLSCASEPKYPYRHELDKFLMAELNYAIGDSETVLIMLPLDTCNPCLKGTVDLIARNLQENFVLVVSGPTQAMKNFGIDKLNLKKERLLLDKDNMYARYELGVSAPVILHFKKGECIFYSETTSSNHPKIINHFDWV